MSFALVLTFFICVIFKVDITINYKISKSSPTLKRKCKYMNNFQNLSHVLQNCVIISILKICSVKNCDFLSHKYGILQRCWYFSLIFRRNFWKPFWCFFSFLIILSPKNMSVTSGLQDTISGRGVEFPMLLSEKRLFVYTNDK